MKNHKQQNPNEKEKGLESTKQKKIKKAKYTFLLPRPPQTTVHNSKLLNKVIFQ